MQTQIDPRVSTTAPEAPSRSLDLVALFLASKPSEATRRAYAMDLRQFFGEEPGPRQVREFLALPPAAMAARLSRYKTDLLAARASEATVNRRLSTVRSLLAFAHGQGLARSDGRGLVEGAKLPIRPEPQPLDPGTLRRLVAAPGKRTLRGRRDTAILCLLTENALRPVELSTLNVGDFSPTDRRLLVRERGHRSPRLPVPLSRRTAEAIAAYLSAAGHEGDAPGPLFRNLDHRPEVAGGRLTPDSFYYLVHEYGGAVGEEDLVPHRLRRAAIYAALEAIGERARRVLRLPEDAAGLEALMRVSSSAQQAARPCRPRSERAEEVYFVTRNERGKLVRVLRLATASASRDTAPARSRFRTGSG